MSEYMYRGFKLSYNIQKVAQTQALYKADGTVVCSLNASIQHKQFHTEYQTHVGAENEIKKLLEDYVNFELKAFLEMRKEHVG